MKVLKSIRIENETWKKLKIIAIKNNLSISDQITAYVENKKEKSK